MTIRECPHYGQCPYHDEPIGPGGARLAHNTLALILAGGRGTRLGPLTDWRAKPAVPFGGKFRIIDFSLSNCVNSGIRRVGICTQYKAQSLIRHVQRGWSFLDGRFNEFIELLPAQQRVTADWYKGTADAVYQNLDLLASPCARARARAGWRPCLQDGLCADAGRPRRPRRRPDDRLHRSPAGRRLGPGRHPVDDTGRITSFQEKPAHPEPAPGRRDVALASMGVYVFNAQFLYEQLIRDADEPKSTYDFGHDVIPHLIARGYRVNAHRFADSCVNMIEGRPYWRDVGTVDAYWDANLDLVQVTPNLNLYDETWPIWTYQEQLPPAKFVFDDDGRRGTVIDSLASGGCIVSGATVRRSLLFSRVHVHSFATIEDSVILGDVDIGRNSVIRRAVIDRHCHLPEGTRIGVDPDEDRRRFHVTAKGVTLVTSDMLGTPIHHLR